MRDSSSWLTASVAGAGFSAFAMYAAFRVESVAS
jgi:hypothetical protein